MALVLVSDGPPQVKVGLTTYTLLTDMEPVPLGGMLINVTVIRSTSTGYYHKHTNYIEAYITAGGGGGMGVTASADTDIWLGNGGGAGVTGLYRGAVSPGGLWSCSIGAGGAGAVGASGTTTAGGNTTFAGQTAYGGSRATASNAGTGATMGSSTLTLFAGGSGNMGLLSTRAAGSNFYGSGMGGPSFWGGATAYNPEYGWDLSQAAPGAGGSAAIAMELDGSDWPGCQGQDGMVVLREYRL